MDYTVVIKLVLAGILGGLVGLERQMRDKPAGLRTNILICVGSTLFMTISTRVAALLGGDPTRIAAQIISGIGFLGAGAVLHSHGFVVGLTTAATIWVVAGIGMALGSGLYGTAVLTTVISIITLTLLSYVEDRMPGPRTYSYALVVTDLNKALSSINQILEEFSVPTSSFNFRKEAEQFRVWFSIAGSRKANLRIIERLSALNHITQVESGSTAKDFQRPLKPPEQ